MMPTKYPWHRLKKPGDHFTWQRGADEPSLRSQAYKHGLARNIIISVKISGKRKKLKAGAGPKGFAKKDSRLVVEFVACRL